MNGEEYFRLLNQSAKSHQDGSDASIDSKYVDFCKKLLQGHISVDSVPDAFLYFAAINYLNAAVKQVKSIGYAFKSRVQVVIAETINNRLPGIRFYLTSDDKGEVVYCLFYERFCFSFHSPSFADEGLKRYLASSRSIEFDGVRKQKCPNLILENAIKLAHAQPKAEVSPRPAPMRSAPAPKPAPRQAYAKEHNNGPVHEVHCLVNVYPIEQIIADYQLNRLVTNRKVAENIAVVISSVFFYKDLINSPNSVPNHIRKEMFREIITQTFSVVEAVEVEVGRRLAKQRHIKLPSEKGGKERDDQNICIDLCQQEYGFDASTKGMYKEYRDLRHNVHLCKDQQIINDNYYTEEVTMKWFSFMEQYLSHLAK